MKNVLCAVDDTENSREAIKVATSLANSNGAKLLVITVNPLLAGVRGGIASYLWEDSQVQKIIDDAVAVAKPTVPAATAVVRARDVSRAILGYAEDNSVDHIVVGTGGKGRLARSLIGSVSNDVVNRAHCAVTVAR